MANLDDQQKHYLEFLLADFSALKTEIGRRSNLQKIVLGLYIAVIAFVFKEFIDVNGIRTSYWIVGLWWGAALASNYYIREHFEIIRLSTLISARIAPPASGILGVSIDSLLHSETNARVPNIDRFTSVYDNIFNWTIYFIIPFVASLFIVFNSPFKVWVSLLSLPAALSTFYILRTHNQAG